MNVTNLKDNYHQEEDKYILNSVQVLKTKTVPSWNLRNRHQLSPRVNFDVE